MPKKRGDNRKRKLLTRRKAQLYLAELVIATLLIVCVILVLLTFQIGPNQTEDQTRKELREQGWNALVTSDELGLLRPAVYSRQVLESSSEISALEEFLNMVLSRELNYRIDGKSQISENTWNIIRGENIAELGEDHDIVIVTYLILGDPHAPFNESILDPVMVILSLWYEL